MENWLKQGFRTEQVSWPFPNKMSGTFSDTSVTLSECLWSPQTTHSKHFHLITVTRKSYFWYLVTEHQRKQTLETWSLRGRKRSVKEASVLGASCHRPDLRSFLLLWCCDRYGCNGGFSPLWAIGNDQQVPLLYWHWSQFIPQRMSFWGLLWKKLSSPIFCPFFLYLSNCKILLEFLRLFLLIEI